VIAAASTSKALWYLTRGTGVVSLVLLTASVAFGIAQVVRYASPRWPRFVVAAVHKNVSLLATVFLAVHILTAIVDSFAHINVIDVLVPFVGAYRPLWLGLGALASDLLLALVVTSLLRERIGYRAWRAVHWAAYACWPVAFLHGLGTGSDTRLTWMMAVNLACLLAVLAAVLVRITRTQTVTVATRATASFASVAVAVGVFAWMRSEPMQPGWARKAGTPTALLASASSTGTAAGSAAAGSVAANPGGLTFPFTSAVRGTIHESSPNASRATVTISAALVDRPGTRLRVSIAGTPLADGGVDMSSGTVRLGTAAAPDLYHGRVVSLDGTDVIASLRSASGVRVTVDMHFNVDRSSSTVDGTVSARAGGAGDGN